jgi:hypothetical protein
MCSDAQKAATRESLYPSIAEETADDVNPQPDNSQDVLNQRHY